MGFLRGLVGGDRVGLYVDGPNTLRAEFDVDLDQLRTVAEEEGTVSIAKVYLDEHAPADLIKATEAHGFEIVTTSGDVDVKLAVDAATRVAADDIDVLVLVSRDMDFKPVLEAAAQAGIRTVAVAPGAHGRSEALQNAAQTALTL